MDYLQKARRVIQIEISELQRLADRLDERFEQAVRLMLETVQSGSQDNRYRGGKIRSDWRKNCGDTHQHRVASVRSKSCQRFAWRPRDRG